MCRKESSAYVRLRIGHTYFSHIHLLKGEPAPFCIGCNENMTIKHLLTKCLDYSHIRMKHYKTNNLKEILSLKNFKNVIGYLKEIQIFSKI